MGTHAKHFIWLAAMLALASSASAQGLPKEKGPARTVKMFDVFCLRQLPDLDGITKAAGFGEFAPITGQELERYQPAVRAEKLYAWSFHDLAGKYVLTAAQSKPDAQFKKSMPAFANATSVACSLLFPASDPEDTLFKELVALLGRGPDKSWDEGPIRVHAWSAHTDKLLSQVHYYAPAKGGPMGVLSATAFVKH